MTVHVTPHLNLRGDARQALEFYRSVFGGELTVITYGDMGAVDDPAAADQVVWGQVAGDDGFRVMAYDVPASRPWSQGDDPFFVSVRGTDPAELTASWERLLTGATPIVPLAPSAWAPLYGMAKDRYGITWVLDIAAAPAAG